ncbi:MAG: serine/threonine-protein phosphatase [Acidobacteriota bacterium]|nr:serine/threonine-protein phosphatase [Acidobacteriota bacterium]
MRPARPLRSGDADLLQRSGMLEDTLVRLRNEQDDMRRAFYDAAQMQRRFCGPPSLRRGPFEIAGEIFPLELISGDFFSVFGRGESLVLAVGDIAGKGLSAGLWFTHIVGMIRLLGGVHEDPAAALGAINAELTALQLESVFTSMFLARLDPQTGTLAYSNAGHPPALLLDANGRPSRLGEGGPLLGAVAGAQFASATLTLRPGESLIGYSDGIAERTNMHGTEFGVDRIVEAAYHSREAGARAMLFSILAAVEDFGGDCTPQDDLAILVVQRAREATEGDETAPERLRV